MSIGALFLAAATPTATPSPPVYPGVQIAQAQVTAVVLRPVTVRQGRGLEENRKDAPRPQRTSREGRVLYEFQ